MGTLLSFQTQPVVEQVKDYKNLFVQVQLLDGKKIMLQPYSPKEIPEELLLQYQAMRVSSLPPETNYIAKLGNSFDSLLKNNSDIYFLPSEVVISGFRAWVLVKEVYKEEGGLDELKYIDGIWVNEELTQKWAEQMLQSPLKKMLMHIAGYKGGDALKYFQVPLLEVEPEAHPEDWEGVSISRKKNDFYEQNPLTFLEKNRYLLESNIEHPAGVYRQYRVTVGLWTGVVFIHQPQLWLVEQVKDENSWDTMISPEYVTIRVRNGEKEFLLMSPPQLKFYYEFTSEFPVGFAKYTPTDASGNWATCWENYIEWEKFALRHRIFARQAYSTYSPAPNPHPSEYETLPFWIPLSREWAELAWESGATKIPREIHAYLSRQDFDKQYPEGELYIANEGHTLFGSTLSCNTVSLNTYKLPAPLKVGWIRCTESNPGFGIRGGGVIREVDDESRDKSELTIYTDGRCIFPKKI